MQIKNILAKKGMNVITIRPDQTLRDVVAVLAQRKIGVLVVVDPGGKPVGIISERDVIRIAHQTEDFFKIRIDAVMTKDVVVGSPDDDLKSVQQTMTQRKFRHLPVMEQGRLVGIVSISDLVKAIVEEYQGEIETLETQITG
jgi:CBS domain-containing protein